MPAIQPAVLRHRTAELAALYASPPDFIRKLHALFDFYADRTYRPGVTSKSLTLMPNYRLPAPVMRQVLIDLSPIVAEHPAETLALIDLLWGEGYLETCLLAVSLLGLYPLQQPEPVLQRLLSWTQPGLDAQVLKALLTTGMKKLQSELPARWLEITGEWLRSSDLDVKAIGLRALQQPVSKEDFENLPGVFTLISPLVHNPPAGLFPEIQALLETLAARSPAETVYFLRQTLMAAQNSGIARLVRRFLPACPAEYQASLREALASLPEESKTKPYRVE